MFLLLNYVVITELPDDKPLAIEFYPINFNEDLLSKKMPSDVKYDLTNIETNCLDCQIDSFILSKDDIDLFSSFFFIKKNNLQGMFIRKLFKIINLVRKIV